MNPSPLRTGGTHPSDAAMPVGAHGQPRVAYVLTHFPKPSQSFLIGEVLTMRAQGATIDVLAINEPDVGDVTTAELAAERDATVYLKQQGPLGFGRAVLGAIRAVGPLALAQIAWMAVRTAGTDLKLIVWRLLQLAEAIVGWAHCRRRGIRHLHAHFGLTTATIAWFVCELGNRAEPGRWSWSFTIHGFQDFANEHEAALAAKAASATYVVCISDFTRAQAMRVIDPADWPKLRVVRCGIDLGRFTPRSAEPSNERPTVLEVGRLSTEKGHLVLLNALAVLRARGVDVGAKFAGDGPYRAAIEHESERLGLGAFVEFLGEVDAERVHRELVNADVFCLPSFNEGLPMSIMESMATGVPVVSTYIGGIPELVTDGVSGMVVPAGDSVRLASAIEALLASRELRSSIIAEGLRRVEALHEITANVSCLRELLATAPGARAN